MTDDPNLAQVEYWNGPSGDRWVREQARIDRAFTPLTAALVKGIAARPGEAVLDVGCGCGELSLLLAGAVGRTGRVVGVDVSEPMLSLAGRRGEELRQVEPESGPVAWRRADAAAATFEAPFDAVVSRFGVMFFSDPVAAFSNLRAALAPGGRLAMLCWQEAAPNRWAALPLEAVTARYGEPDPTPPHAPGPFAFADRERVVGILRAAGFADAAAEPIAVPMQVGVAGHGVTALDDAVSYAMGIGPVSRYIRDRPGIEEGAAEAIRAALAPHDDGETVTLAAACWLYTGSLG